MRSEAQERRGKGCPPEEEEEQVEEVEKAPAEEGKESGEGKAWR